MIDPREIHDRLDQILKRPQMHAGTREALVAQLAVLLDLLGRDGGRLYRLFPRDGSVVLTLGDVLDDAFAAEVVARVRAILSREFVSWPQT